MNEYDEDMDLVEQDEASTASKVCPRRRRRS